MTKKNNLYKSIELSKNIFDYSKSFYENLINYLIFTKLSYSITVYHMDSFYRDNSNDKYELSNQYKII